MQGWFKICKSINAEIAFDKIQHQFRIKALRNVGIE
jgi:hypothetical protein